MMECNFLCLFLAATKLLAGANAFVTGTRFSCVYDFAFIAVKLTFIVTIGTPQFK